MPAKFICFIFFATFLSTLKAQKGNNALTINGEAGIPVYQNETGFGGFIKGLYGISNNAQLTLSAGITRFTTNDIIEQGDVTTRLVPVLVGYRQNIHHFFIEPQVGLGEMGGRLKIAGDYSRPSVTAVFGAIGAGFNIRRFNAGMRFQTAHGIDGVSAGTWYNRNYHYASIFAGYSLFSNFAR